MHMLGVSQTAHGIMTRADSGMIVFSTCLNSSGVRSLQPHLRNGGIRPVSQANFARCNTMTFATKGGRSSFASVCLRKLATRVRTPSSAGAMAFALSSARNASRCLPLRIAISKAYLVRFEG